MVASGTNQQAQKTSPAKEEKELKQDPILSEEKQSNLEKKRPEPVNIQPIRNTYGSSPNRNSSP